MEKFLEGQGLFVIVAVALCFWAIKLAIKIVEQGDEYTVLRLGRYHRTLSPGFHMLVPFYERIGHKINMRERVLDIPRQEIITKDNALATVDGVVYFQVIDAAKAAYAVDNLEYAIMNLSMTNLRTVMGSMPLDDLFSERDVINTRLLSTIDRATDPWGVKVTRVEIKDISPPQALADAMAQQMKAERLRRAQILEAEGLRQSEILRAEGEKQSQVLAAEGKRAAAFLEAEARERMAEAEARATEIVSRAIAQGDVKAVNYFLGQEYVKALAKFAESDQQKTFFLPVEATGLLGTLGGITEMLKSQGSSTANAATHAQHTRPSNLL